MIRRTVLRAPRRSKGHGQSNKGRFPCERPPSSFNDASQGVMGPSPTMQEDWPSGTKADARPSPSRSSIAKIILERFRARLSGDDRAQSWSVRLTSILFGRRRPGDLRRYARLSFGTRVPVHRFSTTREGGRLSASSSSSSRPSKEQALAALDLARNFILARAALLLDENLATGSGADRALTSAACFRRLVRGTKNGALLRQAGEYFRSARGSRSRTADLRGGRAEHGLRLRSIPRST